jgi:hypothetical protein
MVEIEEKVKASLGLKNDVAVGAAAGAQDEDGVEDAD